jgi:hypothetical protein
LILLHRKRTGHIYPLGRIRNRQKIVAVWHQGREVQPVVAVK